MTHRIDIPPRWQRRGLVLSGTDDSCGSFVVGDPCVVRDEEAGLWRMFVFALPPGHAHAVCSGDPADPAAWRLEGPLGFTNPEALEEGTAFKPFVVLDPSRPGQAARFDGLFALLLVTNHDAKVVRRAWSEHLAGPWTIEPGVLIDRGLSHDFDARHVDAVSAWAFGDRGEILYFYMGYPLLAQPHATSALGSRQAAAFETIAGATARGRATLAAGAASTRDALPPPNVRKLGLVLRPSETSGHWASGWVGGLQLLPGRRHRWLGLVNASPTAPRADDTDISREEPPPSLGGFAVCDEEFPVSGWKWCDDPIEWTGDVPADARAGGESVNFWRHHALITDDSTLALFYNAGDYFKEKLFLKVALADGSFDP